MKVLIFIFIIYSVSTINTATTTSPAPSSTSTLRPVLDTQLDEIKKLLPALSTVCTYDNSTKPCNTIPVSSIDKNTVCPKVLPYLTCLEVGCQNLDSLHEKSDKIKKICNGSGATNLSVLVILIAVLAIKLFA